MTTHRSSLIRALAGVAAVVLAVAACALPLALLVATTDAVRSLGRPGVDPSVAAATTLLATGALAASAWVAVGTITAFVRLAPGARVWVRRAPTRRVVEVLLAVALSSPAITTYVTTAAATSETSPATSAPSGRIRVEVGTDGRFVVRDASATTLPPATATATSGTTTTTATTSTPTTTTTPRPTPVVVATPPTTEPTIAARESTSSELDVTTPRHHVVTPGQHLWSISRDALAEHLERVPTDAELLPYWRRVCDHNRVTLRSGDVHLVFPGEVVELPSVDARP